MIQKSFLSDFNKYFLVTMSSKRDLTAIILRFPTFLSLFGDRKQSAFR